MTADDERDRARRAEIEAIDTALAARSGEAFVGGWPNHRHEAASCECVEGDVCETCAELATRARVADLRRQLDAAIDLAAESVINGLAIFEQGARAKATDILAELEALGVDPSEESRR